MNVKLFGISLGIQIAQSRGPNVGTTCILGSLGSEVFNTLAKADRAFCPLRTEKGRRLGMGGVSKIKGF